ncbi:MAG: winged helix-turn-helix transcriptional regulator [Verrucomicrobia bacterium]|nr:winged helix-turn-helix transcriptional regulator [Verrucomicrobiota bacterium]
MLEIICGNKTIKKILLFLFVNGKCYGTQLHHLLKSPLTPLQKGLLRLEKGGLILSHYEGKTRLYQFNPAYPLLTELENLLKKAYTLLPPQEKKQYCLIEKQKEGSEKNDQVVHKFWRKLSRVKQLTFQAKTNSREEGGWNGRGKGGVSITQEGENVLIFNEKGSWIAKDGKETSFSNIFRWTLDRPAGMISLEHLRRGANHPVFLFHLRPSSFHTLSSVDSHLCAGDTYLGQILCAPNCLRLKWRVIGPKKNEELHYYYT